MILCYRYIHYTIGGGGGCHHPKATVCSMIVFPNATKATRHHYGPLSPLISSWGREVNAPLAPSVIMHCTLMEVPSYTPWWHLISLL